MWCRETGCEFESRALRFKRNMGRKLLHGNGLRRDDDSRALQFTHFCPGSCPRNLDGKYDSDRCSMRPRRSPRWPTRSQVGGCEVKNHPVLRVGTCSNILQRRECSGTFNLLRFLFCGRPRSNSQPVFHKVNVLASQSSDLTDSLACKSSHRDHRSADVGSSLQNCVYLPGVRNATRTCRRKIRLNSWFIADTYRGYLAQFARPESRCCYW